MYTIPLI
jgi:large subunit ribosomal protein LP0